jgi:hypothetical protein
MGLSKYIVIIFLSLTPLTPALAKEKESVKKLLTKQELFNIRFISHDGKYTYYQRRSGSLLLSSNYKVKELLKGKLSTQYQVYSSMVRKNMVFEKNEHFHTYLGLRNPRKLYWSKFGGKKLWPMGKGSHPRLHLNDKWASYINLNKKVIYFKNFNDDVLNFSIKLKSILNPYFIPEVIMLNKETVIYTDVNNKGLTGIISFNRSTKKSEVIHKTSEVSTRIELCQSKSSIFVGLFPYTTPYKSHIYKFEKGSINFQKSRPIYTSKSNDLGHIVCNQNKDNISFIQEVNKEKNFHEVVTFNLKDKKINTLSSVKYATQFYNMDGKLILPFRGQYFILDGDQEFGDDSLSGDKKSTSGVLNEQ